ncbi:MAG TPA: hypothetical protein VGA53_04275 [Candidatus Paceibacterota bacterium]
MQVTVGSQRKQFHIPGWSLILFAIVAILGAAYGGMQLTPLFESAIAADTQQTTNLAPEVAPAPQTQLEQSVPPVSVPANRSTSRIEVQQPVFQGRPAPSAAFPQPDGYYIGLGKSAFGNPNVRGYGTVLEYFGDVNVLAVEEVKMQDLGFNSVSQTNMLKIQYLVKANGRVKSYVVTIRSTQAGVWVDHVGPGQLTL